ncbi:MAG: hypothetical protein ACUVTO_00650 [Candidatus Caldatribacteriaceae bacterium]
MLLGILLAILVLYGLLLFWVLNERLKEIHHLVRVSREGVEGMKKSLSELLKTQSGEGREENRLEEEHFPLHFLQSEIRERKGERQ